MHFNWYSLVVVSRIWGKFVSRSPVCYKKTNKKKEQLFRIHLKPLGPFLSHLVISSLWLPKPLNITPSGIAQNRSESLVSLSKSFAFPGYLVLGHRLNKVIPFGAHGQDSIWIPVGKGCGPLSVGQYLNGSYYNMRACLETMALLPRVMFCCHSGGAANKMAFFLYILPVCLTIFWDISIFEAFFPLFIYFLQLMEITNQDEIGGYFLANVN